MKKNGVFFWILLFFLLTLTVFAQTDERFTMLIRDVQNRPLTGYRAWIWDIRLLSIEGNYVGVEEICWAGFEEKPGVYQFQRLQEKESFFTMAYKLTVETGQTVYKQYLTMKKGYTPPFEVPERIMIDGDKKISLMDSEWWTRQLSEGSVFMSRTLEVQKQFVCYSVESNRAGAEVWIGGRLIGKIPLNIVLTLGSECTLQAVWGNERIEKTILVPWRGEWDGKEEQQLFFEFSK